MLVESKYNGNSILFALKYFLLHKSWRMPPTPKTSLSEKHAHTLVRWHSLGNRLKDGPKFEILVLTFWVIDAIDNLVRKACWHNISWKAYQILTKLFSCLCFLVLASLQRKKRHVNAKHLFECTKFCFILLEKSLNH